MSVLREHVQHLAALQRRYELLREALRQGEREAVELYRHVHAEGYQELQELEAAINEAREYIEDMALAGMVATGETEPAPGIKVRRRERLEYKERDAVRWAYDVARVSGTEPADLLQLRKRAAEKLMRAHRPPFVQFVPEYQVTYASNLHEVYGIE